MELISRQAAIDEIVNTVSEIGLHDNSEVARYGATFRQHEIIDIIEGMPSAQPEPLKIDLSGYSEEDWERLKKEWGNMPITVLSAQPEVLACGEGELSAQPERTCVNCGRTVNNGGWYADGRTRCPIEEHYALPKDGYCHLWEKRNVTDDDYPERREE